VATEPDGCALGLGHADGAALDDGAPDGLEPALALALTLAGGGLLPQATAGTAPMKAMSARITCDWFSFIFELQGRGGSADMSAACSHF
jgi:hypothetical protein